MLRGGLRNDETKYETHKRDLENGRQLELQLNPFAVGVVRVE
jgi:hypothetical protein